MLKGVVAHNCDHTWQYLSGHGVNLSKLLTAAHNSKNEEMLMRVSVGLRLEYDSRHERASVEVFKCESLG